MTSGSVLAGTAICWAQIGLGLVSRETSANFSYSNQQNFLMPLVHGAPRRDAILHVSRETSPLHFTRGTSAESWLRRTEASFSARQECRMGNHLLIWYEAAQLRGQLEH
jgi:hypothetical protein